MWRKMAALGASSILLLVLFGCDGGAAAADHSQNIDCPKSGEVPPAEIIYTNRTAHAVDVTGDLKVEDDSCTVRVSPAIGKSFDVKAGKTDSSTVTVPQAGDKDDGILRAYCVPTEGKSKCHWSHHRTSP